MLDIRVQRATEARFDPLDMPDDVDAFSAALPSANAEVSPVGTAAAGAAPGAAASYSSGSIPIVPIRRSQAEMQTKHRQWQVGEIDISPRAKLNDNLASGLRDGRATHREDR